MTKAGWLKIANAALFFCILNQVVTGLASDYLGAVFGVLHPLGGILTALGVAAHVALNWAWVKSNFLR